MTSDHEPGRDEWRPWGGRGASDEPTQESPAREEPVWARLGGGGDLDPPPGGQQQAAAQPAVTQPVPQHQQGQAQASPYGSGPAPYGPQPVTAPPTPTGGRRGPGWGALVGVAVASALLAGLVGGIGGALLTDRESSATPTRASENLPSPGAGATTRPEGSIANIAATVTPSVVTLKVDGADGQGTGSGWVYDEQGHIVTNNHVVASAAERGDITVVLANGTQLDATIVGRDASYDLAVVKVERTDLKPIELGASQDVVVGDQVIAVGAPLGLDSTVTSGIVSALDRPVTPGDQDDQSFINAIQTDAAINPGNSGGPLLDMQGRVIGVNSAIAQAPGAGLGGQGGNIGVGFAIPSAQVRTTADQLIKNGKAVHPVIGVYLDTQYEGEGVRIAETGPNGAPALNPGGPAEKAGLRPGDVVVKFEGKPVTDDGELIVAIRARAVGDEVTLTIRRGGSEQDVTMVLQGSGD